jgi:hypothetical protein
MFDMKCDKYKLLEEEYIERNREVLLWSEQLRLMPRTSGDYAKLRADVRMANRRRSRVLRRMNQHVIEHRCYPDSN